MPVLLLLCDLIKSLGKICLINMWSSGVQDVTDRHMHSQKEITICLSPIICDSFLAKLEGKDNILLADSCPFGYDPSCHELAISVCLVV